MQTNKQIRKITNVIRKPNWMRKINGSNVPSIKKNNRWKYKKKRKKKVQLKRNKKQWNQKAFYNCSNERIFCMVSLSIYRKADEWFKGKVGRKSMERQQLIGGSSRGDTLRCFFPCWTQS